jgi:hypothetical protein
VSQYLKEATRHFVLLMAAVIEEAIVSPKSCRSMILDKFSGAFFKLPGDPRGYHYS